MYTDASCWMIRCKFVIHQGGELHLGSRGLQSEVMQIIDQSNTTSDTVRRIKAIKAMRSMIWPKRYNQRYGQSDQSDQSDGINDMARAIRSKRYSQQYDQDKPVSSYIVSKIYVKAKDLSKGPILGGCRKINNGAIPDSIR